jgi:hypothetical protein
MKDLAEQSVCMKFCLKLATSFIECHQTLKQDVEGMRTKEEA